METIKRILIEDYKYFAEDNSGKRIAMLVDFFKTGFREVHPESILMKYPMRGQIEDLNKDIVEIVILDDNPSESDVEEFNLLFEEFKEEIEYLKKL